MKLRNIELPAGIKFSAFAIVGGISLIVMPSIMDFISGESEGPGAFLIGGIIEGLMFLAGLLIASVGALVGLVSIIRLSAKKIGSFSPQDKKENELGSIISAEKIDSSSPQHKKKIQLGSAIVIVVCVIGFIAILIFLKEIGEIVEVVITALFLVFGLVSMLFS